MGGGAAILFFLFLGSATFCGLFCPVISPSTKAPRSAAGGWMGRRTKSVLRTGGGFGQPALCGRSSEDSCKSPLQLFHVPSADTEARVLCGKHPFCALKPTEYFGAVTIPLVRV